MKFITSHCNLAVFSYVKWCLLFFKSEIIASVKTVTYNCVSLITEEWKKCLLHLHPILHTPNHDRFFSNYFLITETLKLQNQIISTSFFVCNVRLVLTQSGFCSTDGANSVSTTPQVLNMNLPLPNESGVPCILRVSMGV